MSTLNLMEVTPRVTSTIGKRVCASLANGITVLYVVVSGLSPEDSEAFAEYVLSMNADAPLVESDVDSTRTASAIRNAARAKKMRVILAPIKDADTDTVYGFRVVSSI